MVQSKGISQSDVVPAAQPNTTPLKTQPRNPGTKAGKYGDGKADTSSWYTYKGGKAEQFGSGGAPWKGKGGGKPGGKDYGKFTYAGKGAGSAGKSKAAQTPKGRKVKEET